LSAIPDQQDNRDTPRRVVGVTGHRRLPDDARLTARVLEVLQTLCGAGHRLVVLSALAEGADRLVAEVGLAPPLCGALHALLPFDVADYRRDNVTPGSLAEFQSLLDRAEMVEYPAPPPGTAPPSGRGGCLEGDARDAAYEWCGFQTVDRCDVLLTLWDGQPARGRGGTADVVAYARRAGKPLAWIHTTPPYEAVYERLPSRD
jgi:hypothetical protein